MNTNLVQVNWESRKRVLFNNLNSLRNKEIHTDIVLSCDGQNYPAHRLILTMSSGYFARAFEINKEASPLVLICGITGPIFQSLLSFIYDGTTTIKSEDIPELLRAGLVLEVPGLMEMGTGYKSLNASSKSGNSNKDCVVSAISSSDNNDGTKPSTNQSNTTVKKSGTPSSHAEVGEETEIPVKKEKIKKGIARTADNEKIASKKTVIMSAESLFISDSSDSEDKVSFKGWEEAKINNHQAEEEQTINKGGKRSHRCRICSKKCATAEALIEHINDHNKSEEDYSCDSCGKCFSNEKTYNSHLNTHKTNESTTKEGKNGNIKLVIKSSRRSKPMPDIPANKRTKRQKVEQDPLEEKTIDDVLESVSQSFKNLSNGQQWVTDDSIYDEGSSVVQRVSAIVPHMEEGSMKRDYILKLKESLKFDKSVSSVNTRICNHCSIEFLNNRSFKRHRMTDCKVLECPYCLKNFENKPDYDQHTVIHNGSDKPYTCPKCIFCTDNRRSFEDHISLHTGIFRFWCLLCDYQTRKLSDLKSHTSTSHPEIDLVALDHLLSNYF